jgi:hypothetical protein
MKENNTNFSHGMFDKRISTSDILSLSLSLFPKLQQKSVGPSIGFHSQVGKLSNYPTLAQLVERRTVVGREA